MLQTFSKRKCWQTVSMVILCLCCCFAFCVIYPAQEAKAIGPWAWIAANWPFVAKLTVSLVISILAAIGVSQYIIDKWGVDIEDAAQAVLDELDEINREAFVQHAWAMANGYGGSDSTAYSQAYADGYVMVETDLVQAVADAFIRLYGAIEPVLSGPGNGLTELTNSYAVIDGFRVGLGNNRSSLFFHEYFTDTVYSRFLSGEGIYFAPFPSVASSFGIYVERTSAKSLKYYLVDLSTGTLLSEERTQSYTFTDVHSLDLSFFDVSSSRTVFYLQSLSVWLWDATNSFGTNFGLLYPGLVELADSIRLGTAVPSTGETNPVYISDLAADLPDWNALKVDGYVPVSTFLVADTVAGATTEYTLEELLNMNAEQLAEVIGALGTLPQDIAQGLDLPAAYASFAEYAAAMQAAIAAQIAATNAAAIDLEGLLDVTGDISVDVSGIRKLLVTIGAAIAGIGTAVREFFNAANFTLDFSKFQNLVMVDRFPFCIPFDFAKAIKTFAVNASNYQFKIDVDTQYWQAHHTVDMSPFAVPFAFFRYAACIWWAFVLISKTRDLMKW